MTFGDRLFVRTGNAMVPTPVAQSLIGPVRQALRQLRASVDQLKSFEPATSEKIFNISLGDSAATTLMPAVVAGLRTIAPHVRVHCSQVDRREIASELASGNLDFALDIPELEKPDLNGVEILKDRFVCVLRQGHPDGETGDDARRLSQRCSTSWCRAGGAAAASSTLRWRGSADRPTRCCG